MAVSAFAALTTTAVTAATVGTFALFGTAVSAFTFFAAMTATYAVLGAISRELFSQPTMDVMNGINFNVRDPASTRKMIYGKCRIGGTIVFFNTSDTDNNYLHMVIAVAGHEINAYKEVYFGNTKVWENGSYVDDGTRDWEDHCLLSFHKGDQTTADSTLVNAATGFTNLHILQDTAYVYVRLDYDAEAYVAGVPNISFVVEGKKILDPRNSTTAFSNNPALVLYDYLRDTKYGLGEAVANIDVDSFEDAADVCDETVNIINGSQKRYTCDGILDSGTTIKTNIENILSSMVGTMHHSNGKFSLQVGKYYTHHADAIREDDIVSAVTHTTKRSHNSQYNKVKGKFISSENNYIVSDYPTQEISGYESEDGDALTMELLLPMTTDNVMAQRIANLTLKKSRAQKQISLQCNLSALQYKVGDTVIVNYPRLSINSTYTITEYKIVPDEQRGLVVDLKLSEETQSTYNWTTAEQKDFIVAADVDVYSGTEVVAPTNLALYDNGEEIINKKLGVLAQWDGVQQIDLADPYEPYFDHYRVEVTDNADNFAQVYTTTDTKQRITLHSVIRHGARTHTVKVYAVNVRGYRSDPISVTGRLDDFFPRPPVNKDLIVYGTQASPSAEYLLDLLDELGLVIREGQELTYVYVLASDPDTVLDVQLFEYTEAELTVHAYANNEPTVDSTLPGTNFIENGTFDDASGWELDGINISNGTLNFSNTDVDDIAITDVISNTTDARTVTFTVSDYSAVESGSAIRVGFYMMGYPFTTVAVNDFTGNGTKTMTIPRGSDRRLNCYIRPKRDDMDFKIDNFSVANPSDVGQLSDAIEKFEIRVPVGVYNVTWTVTDYNVINDSACTVIRQGVTGTNLVKAGRTYCVVGLQRDRTEVGYNSQNIQVKAEWTQPVTIDGVVRDVIKKAQVTLNVTVRVW